MRVLMEQLEEGWALQVVHSYTDMAIFVLKEVQLCSSSSIVLWLTSSLELRAYTSTCSRLCPGIHPASSQQRRVQMYLLQSSARTCLARGDMHRQAGPLRPAHPPIKSGPTVTEVTIWVTCISDVKTSWSKA